jgi:hypothetical protein
MMREDNEWLSGREARRQVAESKGQAAIIRAEGTAGAKRANARRKAE